MFNFFRIQLIVLVIGGALYIIHASASSAIKSDLHSGEGGASISGWHISNIDYGLAKDPTQISRVEFDLDGRATQVVIGFGSALVVLI